MSVGFALVFAFVLSVAYMQAVDPDLSTAGATLNSSGLLPATSMSMSTSASASLAQSASSTSNVSTY